jgi:hypothetical protein
MCACVSPELEKEVIACVCMHVLQATCLGYPMQAVVSMVLRYGGMHAGAYRWQHHPGVCDFVV